MATPVKQSFKLMLYGLRKFALEGKQTQKNINKQLKHADQKYQLKKYKWKPKKFADSRYTVKSFEEIPKHPLFSPEKMKRLRKHKETFDHKYKIERVEEMLRKLLKPKYTN